MKSVVAILALGSNKGDRTAHLDEASRRINERVGKVIARARYIETKAEGYDGADYLNGALSVETRLTPLELLDACKSIEREMGRTRDSRDAGQYEDRAIDIDIILYGDTTMTTDRLTIPHPRAARRDFVIRPLKELGINIETNMKLKTTIEPDWIFETSWEVCNRVGGIYTVLSTKAETLQEMYNDHLVFIGPDVWSDANPSPFFKDMKTPISAWQTKATKEGLTVRIGRWNIPGEPICILVNHRPFMEEERLNQIYAKAWTLYGVDSLHGYGDYAESTAFAVASGLVMVSLREWLEKKQKGGKYIAHFNEWMLGMGELVVKELAPDMATVFTTHATSIGRSIAGNGKPLYGQLPNYNGDQMAVELNMQSKHSIEKIAAHEADCFTTVSEVTDRECAQLLEKPADVVTPNGFEDSFVPATATEFKDKRAAAREKLSDAVECLTGMRPSKDALFIGTCGRCEFKNKGIDLFIDSLNTLSHRELKRDIIGFIMVPGWEAGPRSDLRSAMNDLKKKPKKTDENNMPKAGLPNNMITHHLHQSDSDNILRSIRWFGFQNRKQDKVKIIYVPCYLNGDDGIFDLNYYDVLIGLDLTAFPSYYEPWGYTPLESVAFSIPTITTTLSGFGQWLNSTCGDKESGVRVIPRDDNNYWEVRDVMADCFYRFSELDESQVNELRKAAKATSQKALWKKFIAFYVKTYTFALKNAEKRNQH